jgi:SAM-dependent methyltransferase
LAEVIGVPISGYRYASAGGGHHHAYLLPTVFKTLDTLDFPAGQARLFELGCGNGSVANALHQRGWEVTGVDPSVEGIAQARAAYPELKLYEDSAYDDLADQYGQFPVVLLSLEVVEHVYAPRHYARTLFDLLEPGGTAILSTPYHGSGPGAERQDGCPFHCPVGPRAYQVLVETDLGRAAAGGGFCGDPLRVGRASAGAGEGDDCGGAEAVRKR